MEQKSRVDWLRMGERNTKFLHTSTIIRRRRNGIESLQNDLGEWVSDQNQLLGLAKECYSDLFKFDGGCTGSFTKGHFLALSSSQVEDLAKDFSDEEIVSALKGMNPNEASGPDGFNARFYQRTWNTTGKRVMEFVKKVQQSGHLPSEIAKVLLVLNPKVENPNRPREYRSISLCNVIYKLVIS